jgi:hypothetical protein
VSKWPAGPGRQGAKNEPRGVAFSPFALVGGFKTEVQHSFCPTGVVA